MKIGLVGLGTHGRGAVIPAILGSSRAQLTALADLNETFLQEASQKAPQATTWRDAREMCAKADIDVVYIATLVDTHMPLALLALEHGKHVVCEKPMAVSSQECRRMIDAARQAGRHLIVDFECRLEPHLGRLRRQIAQGVLGRVHAVHLVNFWDGHKNFGPMAARRARLVEAAGALDCGIHKLDMARFLVGGGQWKRLSAVGAWLEEPFTNPPHIGVVGTLSNGVMVTVNASLGYATAITPRPMQDMLTIVGTQGVASYVIDVDSPAAFHQSHANVTLYTSAGVESYPVEHQPHTIAIANLLDTFAQVIDDGRPFEEVAAETGMPTGEDGYQAQVAVEAANTDAIANRVTVDATPSALPHAR